MVGGITLTPLKTKIEVDIKSFKSQMSEAATAGVKAAQDMSQKMSNAANVGKSLQKAGSTMTKAFTVPLVGAGVACTKFYLTAEDSFAKVNTIIDQTKVSNEDLHRQVKDASNDTGVAIEDFNEALYSSISAGIDSGKAIQFTTDMTKLAKGGFTSTEQAVNVVTTALNAYGMGADQATAVSDKLITTQNLGKTTVNELASSMGKVIPTANSYGVNIDNVCTSLADLTKNGIATAEATTYYNSMLNELGKSGTKVSGVIKDKMGASFTDLMNQGVPLTDVLKVVKDSAEENGLALGDMFGSAEAAKAALTIMKDDGVEYNQILNQMETSAGATDKAFKTMDETPLQQLKKALNELKNVAIEFGGKMAPAVKVVTDVLKSLGDRFASLTPEQQEFIVKAGLLVAALGPVLSVVGKGVSIFTKLAPVVSGAGTALKLAGGAMSLLTGPAGIAVAAIGGIVAGGVALYKNWDKVKEKAGQLKDWVSEKWNGLKESVSNTVDNLKNAVSEKWEALKTGVSNVAENIKSSVSEKWESIKTATAEKFGAVKDKTAEIFGNVKDKATELMETAKNNVKTKLNDMKAAYDDAGGGIKGIASAAFTGVKGIISDQMSAANTLTGGKLDKIKDAFKSKLESAKSTASNLLDKIKNGFSDKMESAKGGVKSALEKIKGFFNFSWSLPKIKMPHFKIKGSFSLNPPSIPHIGVDWYKDGAIMNGATIFGMNGGKLLGGGEAGKEAILPLEGFYQRLNAMLDNKLASLQTKTSIPIQLQNNVYLGKKLIKRELSEWVMDDIYGDQTLNRIMRGEI